jgi:hypothetical protein
MTKQFWGFFGIGVAVVGIIAAFVWFGNKSSHLELTGKILKVRVVAIDKESSLVLVDFRVTNPSAVLFVAGEVKLFLEPKTGEPAEGLMVTKGDVETIFKAMDLTGPKFNDVFSLQDKIPPGQTLDRMTEARFELPESAIQARKTIRLHMQDVDGSEADLVEASPFR